MLQRSGQVVIRMLADVKQTTIAPLIHSTIAQGTLMYTDEYDIYCWLRQWGYEHKTVCHSKGEYAPDEDGDGFHEVHVNTIEGFWSLLRSWGPIEGFLRRNSHCIWASLSSYTMLENEVELCSVQCFRPF